MRIIILLKSRNVKLNKSFAVFVLFLVLVAVFPDPKTCTSRAANFPPRASVTLDRKLSCVTKFKSPLNLLWFCQSGHSINKPLNTRSIKIFSRYHLALLHRHIVVWGAYFWLTARHLVYLRPWPGVLITNVCVENLGMVCTSSEDSFTSKPK